MNDAPAIHGRGYSAGRAFRQVLDRLNRFHKRRATTSFILSFGVAATEGLGLIILVPLLAILGFAAADASPLVERIPIVAEHIDSVGVAVGVFLGLLIIRQGIVYLQRTSVADTRLAFVKKLRMDLFRALGAASWEHYSANSMHRQMQILAIDSQRAGDAAHHLFSISAAAFVASIQLALAIWISPVFALVAVLSLTALILLGRRKLRETGSLGTQYSEHNDAFFKIATNFSVMQRTARLSGGTNELDRLFHEQNERIGENMQRFVRRHTANAVTIQLVAGIILSACLAVSISVLSIGPIQISILILIFARLTPIIGQIFQLVYRLAHDLPAVHNTIQSIRTWQSKSEPPEATGSTISAPERNIGLLNVSHRYGEKTGSFALQDVSIDLPVAELTLLRGPTGSGKTTLADVLSGLLPAAEGSVVLDGHRLDSAELRHWRRQVGYVDQEAALFSGTIEENIVWGANAADSMPLDAAARAALVTSFIHDMPNLMHSPVGDRGARLSGGQRQRIAIARELIRKPVLLILDEATSGLDVETESELLRRLLALEFKPTILLISHRNSAVRFANRTIELADGRVISTTVKGQGKEYRRLREDRAPDAEALA